MSILAFLLLRGQGGRLVLIFLALSFAALLLHGCAEVPKTETGALSCRGSAFILNPTPAVEASK